MPVGKKQTTRVTFSSGVIAETTTTLAEVLNYVTVSVHGMALISGQCNITVKVYGTGDESAEYQSGTPVSGYWTEISSVLISSTGVMPITNIVDKAFSQVKVTHQKTSSGLGTLVVSVVKKRY